MIDLIAVGLEQKELLYNIHQKYLYEMTSYYDDEMDAAGNFHYGYFDAYFEEPERTALLICDGQTIVGFAMINPYSYIHAQPDHVLAEFTVFPMYRRRHIAAEAAQMILDRFPGRWEIKYNEKNIPARRLWNKVTEKYHPKRIDFSDVETVLAFSTGE